MQAPTGVTSDILHESEKDPTHFEPLDGVWKVDGDNETFDMDDGSIVHGTMGLLFCINSAGCVVDCLRAIARMAHDSHLRQSIVSQPGLLQLLCAMATKGGCAQTNDDYDLVMEVCGFLFKLMTLYLNETGCRSNHSRSGKFELQGEAQVGWIRGTQPPPPSSIR